MTEQELVARVGANVRRYRERMGLTQADLAGQLASAGNTIARLERGEKGASLAMLCKLADALDVDPAELLRAPG